MQIVIDIPTEQYSLIRQSYRNGVTRFIDKEAMMYAIKNGIPLPKGHGYLIDASRKITVTTYDEQYEEWGQKTMTIIEALNKWSDEGVRVEDVIIPANKKNEE